MCGQLPILYFQLKALSPTPSWHTQLLTWHRHCTSKRHLKINTISTELPISLIRTLSNKPLPHNLVHLSWPQNIFLVVQTKNLGTILDPSLFLKPTTHPTGYLLDNFQNIFRISLFIISLHHSGQGHIIPNLRYCNGLLTWLSVSTFSPYSLF